MDRKAAKHDEATNHRSALESMGKDGWRRDRASVIEVCASRSVTWPHPVRVQRSPRSSVRFGNDAFTRQDLHDLTFSSSPSPGRFPQQYVSALHLPESHSSKATASKYLAFWTFVLHMLPAQSCSEQWSSIHDFTKPQLGQESSQLHMELEHTCRYNREAKRSCKLIREKLHRLNTSVIVVLFSEVAIMRLISCTSLPSRAGYKQDASSTGTLASALRLVYMARPIVRQGCERRPVLPLLRRINLLEVEATQQCGCSLVNLKLCNVSALTRVVACAKLEEPSVFDRSQGLSTYSNKVLLNIFGTGTHPAIRVVHISIFTEQLATVMYDAWVDAELYLSKCQGS